MPRIKKFFQSQKAMKNFVLLLFVLQPVFDLDYLIYPFLDQFGIPRPSTIIRFLIIPFAVLWCFFLADKNKKKTLLFGGLYGIALAIYFLLHIRQGSIIYKNLYLTPNFFFQLSKEITYFLTLIIPYGMIYCVYHLRLTEKMIKGVTVALSSLTALPIFIGDLFVFGEST